MELIVALYPAIDPGAISAESVLQYSTSGIAMCALKRGDELVMPEFEQHLLL